jgi:hypothetical protein
MLGRDGKTQFEGCRGVVTTPLARKSKLDTCLKERVRKKWPTPLRTWARFRARVRVVLHPYTPQPEDRRIWRPQQANRTGLGERATSRTDKR